MRRTSREYAFKFIFETIFSNQFEEIDFSLREDDYAFLQKEVFQRAVEIYKTFLSHQKFIINLIENNVKGYTLDRMFKIDLALLCLAITEHTFLKEPLPVVANEMVLLAKIYSTEKSAGFLNGVISTIYGDKNV